LSSVDIHLITVAAANAPTITTVVVFKESWFKMMFATIANGIVAKDRWRDIIAVQGKQSVSFTATLYLRISDKNECRK
jgi:hypothetical protein